MYHRCQEIFFETFSLNELVENVSADKLLNWKAALQTKFATASIAGFVKTAKMVFNWAVDHDWLKKIPNGSFVNRDNDRVISMAEYAKLLNACPNQEWRTIIALARIGGLRCPSELGQLRWSDVTWGENRFLVHSPKTERHEGHQKRLVPLFPELRSELERHYSLDETKGNEFVIQGFQNSCWNLHTAFQVIAKRAGLGKIVRPFDNMRMSRSNEVERKFGSKKKSLWIGHSDKVMLDHHLVLEDEDYLEAAEGSLENEKPKNPHAEDHAKPTTNDGKIE
jgi:integrase